MSRIAVPNREAAPAAAQALLDLETGNDIALVNARSTVRLFTWKRPEQRPLMR